MTAEQLERVPASGRPPRPALQRWVDGVRCRVSGCAGQAAGYDVAVADLTRYKARATSWRLSDEVGSGRRLAARKDGPYWWQHSLASGRVGMGVVGRWPKPSVANPVIGWRMVLMADDERPPMWRRLSEEDLEAVSGGLGARAMAVLVNRTGRGRTGQAIWRPSRVSLVKRGQHPTVRRRPGFSDIVALPISTARQACSPGRLTWKPPEVAILLQSAGAAGVPTDHGGDQITPGSTAGALDVNVRLWRSFFPMLSC